MAGPLSLLSFMQPARIARNIEAARVYKGLPETAPVFEVMATLQGFPIDCFPTADRHQRVTAANLEALRPAIAAIMGGQIPESFAFINPEQFQAQSMLAVASERQWLELYPVDFEMYDALVRRVIYAYRDGYSGGSVSSHIGYIWLSPESDWTVSTYLEDLIHEYVHNVLFLEEMVHTLFSVSAAKMAEPQNRVVSSIRRVPRYFDQSFHAAAVAIVLAEHALIEGRSNSARLYAQGLLPSLDAMKNLRPVMSDHGWTLLREMIDVGLRLYDSTQPRALAA